MKKIPKIALVHDYLKEYGGAESVLETLSDIFSQADIYTALYTYFSSQISLSPGFQIF